MGFYKQHNVIGLMSGTSLDGVDLAYIRFYYDKRWRYELGVCQTIPYDEQWLNELKTLHLKSLTDIHEASKRYAKYLSQLLKRFIHENSLEVDCIASHGHTVLHQPEKGITLQIGDGQELHKQLGIPVVFDFRSLDVALGGQGAPLVPVGDELLFKEYDYCLNLGGFSNFSYSEDGQRLAYDICPLNIALNPYANRLGHSYDNKGELAQSGTLNKQLLESLNGLTYYRKSSPKSLGKEWLEQHFMPLMDAGDDTIENKLRTLVEHMAIQIGHCIPQGHCLISGGGAFNTFLIQRMKVHSKANFIVPDKKLIEYKEALIFGLLAVLKVENQINCLASVTGAKRDSVVGQYVA